MPVKPDLEQANFGLLPEPERSPGSFITSTVINGLILAFAFYIGMTAKKAIDQHRYEETLLICRPSRRRHRQRSRCLLRPD